MLADWLSQRPAGALSDFMIWILKEILEDAHAHSGSHKSSKVSATPSQKTKVIEVFSVAIILNILGCGVNATFSSYELLLQEDHFRV